MSHFSFYLLSVHGVLHGTSWCIIGFLLWPPGMFLKHCFPCNCSARTAWGYGDGHKHSGSNRLPSLLHMSVSYIHDAFFLSMHTLSRYMSQAKMKSVLLITCLSNWDALNVNSPGSTFPLPYPPVLTHGLRCTPNMARRRRETKDNESDSDEINTESQ